MHVVLCVCRKQHTRTFIMPHHLSCLDTIMVEKYHPHIITYMFMYTYIYVHIICTSIYICIYIYIKHMHTHTHAHVHVHMHMRHSTCTNLSYKCVHTYTSMITHAHAHTHTPLICTHPDISCVNVIHTLMPHIKLIFICKIYCIGERSWN